MCASHRLTQRTLTKDMKKIKIDVRDLISIDQNGPKIVKSSLGLEINEKVSA